MTPARILIVDDDGVVLRTFVRVLCEYAPLHAVDGETARTILGETQIDVVVCDLGLPGLQGLDLMRWAKVHCPKPLWIFVSGEGTFDDAIQALKLGAFDFICKPIISAIQLQKAVANAVRHLSLVAERAQLLRSLADNNLRLAEGHTQLEMANAELQNQRAMLDRDLERADRIVRAILPHALAPIPKLHVSVAYRPSASIGGDFYGATLLDERHLAVYVADAAGHGVSAALLAVLFHQRLSFLNAHGGIRTPAAILADLNHDLLEECRASGLFVTVAYALIDTVARTATIASAGHPPCIWIHAGASEHLDKTGPALGLSADAAYTEHHVSLGDDDRLLLYTDGLTGAISERAPSLETILASVVTKGDDGGRVIDRLLTWTEHGRVEDDLTLLLVSANTGVSRVDADQVATHVTAHVTGPLSLGSDERTTWVVVRGRATWKDAAALRDTSIDALDAGRSVIVDLASCTALDSTMLGTLHELVVQAATRRGSLHVQSAGETIRALFTELAMTQVLSSIASRAQPAPVHMDAPPPHSDAGARELVLHAHVLLAELSASNAEQFQPVIAALERDPAL